jgi:Rieske Fe-S protein
LNPLHDVDPHEGQGTSHEPTPTIWPVGFAIGIACIFVGLIISHIVLAVGVVIAAIFGFLWVRDATKPFRGEETPAEPGPSAALPPGEPAVRRNGPDPGEGEIVRYPRSKFLEATTLGLGGLIGIIVTAPVLGFTVLPPFIKQGHPKIDVGAIEDFPENKFVIATYLLKPSDGEVSRRTAYIRNNGLLGDSPSFTVLSNRCVHLGCPVQVNGLPLADETKTERTAGNNVVTRIPTAAAAGFGCPCHGGQYDTEGNRTAGPPVRALDRYEFAIVDGRLLLGQTFSVSEVDGTGAEAKIHTYPLAGPGQHVDGPEGWLYPVQPPR